MATTFPQFIAEFERFMVRPMSKSALNQMGNAVIKRIRQVTSGGKTFARGKIERLAPLTKSTKAQKRRKGKSTKSRLRDTGDMMRSLKTTTNVGQQTVTVQASGADNEDKSIFAHEGSSNRPVRPFIPDSALDKKTQKIVEDILVKELNRQLRRL